MKYKSNGTGPPREYSVMGHARNYVAAMPPAISGQGGHNQTYAVTCVLIQGFGLCTEDAWKILSEYNERCQPPWSEKELWHKLNDAEKAEPPLGGKGCMALEKGRSQGSPYYYPPIKEEVQFETFLKACFEPNEIVSIVPGIVREGETRAVPKGGGVNYTRDQWIERTSQKGGIHRLFSTRDGLFIRINPVVAHSKGTDKDVTASPHPCRKR